MPGFVNNPRRTPRAAIGCDARVALKNGRFFTGATVDCGPQGCQLVSPTPLSRDERVFVELKGEGGDETYWFSGRIAWAAACPPFRAGVHFDAGSAGDAKGLFFKLADSHPDAVDSCAAPTQVAADSLLVPAHVAGEGLGAREGIPLSPGEAEVMRAVGGGIRVCELREKLGDRWEPSLKALFSLLSRSELMVKAPDRPDLAP